VNREIERKFKVVDDRWRSSVKKTARIVQGYLSRDSERVVRVRTTNDEAAAITIKGVRTGVSRAEFEYAIPIEDARELLHLCLQPPIEKTRHYVKDGELTWEIDEFQAPQHELVIAELELPTADHEFERPGWLGAEVTANPLFYNQNITFRRP
jgi:adenylate cyclase